MISGVSPLIFVGPGCLLLVGCLIGAFINLRHKRTIDDLPTSRTQGVFIGISELKGTAESEAPLKSYLAGIKCVQYSWNVEEHWSRTVTETYHDSKGTHTRTRTESGWKRVDGEDEAVPFYLKDDTGILRIVPEKAAIHNKETFSKTCGREDPLYYSKGPPGAVANSTHKRRFRESAIPLHSELYIVGQARERQDVAAAEIAYSKDSPLFIISMRTERQVSSRFGVWLWFWFVIGAILALGTGALWSIASVSNIIWQPFVIMFCAYLFAAFIAWTWSTYNTLVGLGQQVKQAWSQIDIQLKRRSDLIPNLATAVESYQKFEAELFRNISEIRGQISATPSGHPGPDYAGVAPLIRLLAERYPDLKANQNFLKLQQELVDTEQRIALARDYYNNIVTFFNNRLEMIPDRYMAVILSLKKSDLFRASDFERAALKVDLKS